MSDQDLDHDDQKPKGVFFTLLADGNWLYRKAKYQNAIDAYTKALTLKPDDRTCLVGRSRCYLKTDQYENALEDAETSLVEDKTYVEGLYQKAEALYYMGEFEFALVFYHRGQNLRPQIEKFRLGIQKAQEAIENSVGSPSSVKLEIKGDLSFFQEDQERAQPITVIQNLTMEKKQLTQKTSLSQKTTKQQLGEFDSDKKFLENLLKDQGLVKGRTKSGEQMQDVIQSCLISVDTCTEFLNQMTPFCPRGRESKHMQQKCSKPQHNAPSEPAHLLVKSLDGIDAELASGNAEESLKKAEEVLKIVQEWSEKEVPTKKEVLGRLHSCIGNALVELGDMDKALDHHQKDLDLAKQCKLPDAMSRALENIGRIFAQTGRISQAIEFWEKKIPLVCGGLEKAWLFHEIGWCYMELSYHDEARDCGIRSLAAADEIAHEKWQMTANVLVAQSELKLGNFKSCVSHFERALTQAQLQEDDAGICAIQKALGDAKQFISQ
ncbi:Tetratricopeptide repeat protein 25 [Larimichthys crocea]|uniref:Uncharacterized protein n=1 Tax=Larimichthys crocea TaxID=215358 RepID=A0ACD3R794_LARCR|nr:Tetratricopeptide repeat protein 25 [Larimichthys crocea]